MFTWLPISYYADRFSTPDLVKFGPQQVSRKTPRSFAQNRESEDHRSRHSPLGDRRTNGTRNTETDSGDHIPEVCSLHFRRIAVDNAPAQPFSFARAVQSPVTCPSSSLMPGATRQCCLILRTFVTSGKCDSHPTFFIRTDRWDVSRFAHLVFCARASG